MSENASLKAVSRHLPLIRVPLLINNMACLIVSIHCSIMDPIYRAQLVFIAISFLIGLFDFQAYDTKKRALRQGQTNVDQDVQATGSTIVEDGVLSAVLLIISTAGLAKSTRHGVIFIIATTGALIAWYDCSFIRTYMVNVN